jgi:hypothetical protein
MIIFNISQNLFIWNNGITNILDLKLCKGIYATYIRLTRPRGGRGVLQCAI